MWFCRLPAIQANGITGLRKRRVVFKPHFLWEGNDSQWVNSTSTWASFFELLTFLLGFSKRTNRNNRNQQKIRCHVGPTFKTPPTWKQSVDSLQVLSIAQSLRGGIRRPTGPRRLRGTGPVQHVHRCPFRLVCFKNRRALSCSRSESQCSQRKPRETKTLHCHRCDDNAQPTCCAPA